MIITYRKDDGKINRLSTLLSNNSSVVNYVKLENMDQNELMDLVCTAMHRHKEIDIVLLKPLVDFISKKTKGNPFYACQLLTTLEKKGLIYFDWEQNKWEYNLKKIEMALLFNEVGGGDDGSNNDGNLNNIEFLVRRLKELPPDGQRFLKWAAFIGNHFNYETVRHLMMTDDENNNNKEQQQKDKEKNIDNKKDDTNNNYKLPPRTSSLRRQQQQKETSNLKVKSCDTINGLQSALQQGFIHSFSNDEFGFSHDRYSQAAMLLAKYEDKDQIHLKIATYFMDQPGVDIFWVADHIKAALGLIQQLEDNDNHENNEINNNNGNDDDNNNNHCYRHHDKNKLKYRTILIRAGDHAYHSGAHNLAFTYYVAAKDLLPKDPWMKSTTTTETTIETKDNNNSNNVYLETLHLYTQLAEISWSLGYDLTQSLITTILSNAKSAIDRAPAYRLQHRYQWSHQQKLHDAHILLTCLNELGVKHLELDVPDHELQLSYQQIREKVLNLGLDNILLLPICESRLIRTRLSILEEL